MDTNKAKEIAKAIFNEIKKQLVESKKKKDVNHPYYSNTAAYFQTDSIYDRAVNKYVDYIRVGKKEFRGMEDTNDIQQVSNMVVAMLNEQKKVKGWKNIVFTTRDFRELRGSGWNQYWKNYSILENIYLLDNPCKDFVSIQKFLLKYANYNLADFKLFSVRMGGKRGRLYDEEGDRYYLANKEKKCASILEELRKHRGTNDTITCQYGEEEYIDELERRYSSYHETECDGEKRSYLAITIKTPAGKVKYQTKIY